MQVKTEKLGKEQNPKIDQFVALPLSYSLTGT